MRGLQAARGTALTHSAPPPEDHGDPDPAGESLDDQGVDRGDHDGTGVVGAGSAAPAVRPRRTLLLLMAAALVLALDVATKVAVVAELEGRRQLEWLGGQLLIRVSRNPGAAFSFAEGATVLFTLVAIVVIVVIVRISARLQSAAWALSLGLLLGGAAGNLVDRLLRSPGVGRGAVVDFIDFQVWPSFNIADSAIVTGGCLAVLLSFRGIEVDGTRTPKATADPEQDA